ncbi:MAG TPA: HPr family phosphocarrier protein [Anaerolineales bacterium]
MEKIILKVINEVGLHARPAADFVRTAGQFKSKIEARNLTTGSPAADAKSILSVLMLGVERGHEIELTAQGEDEAEAVQALRALIESDFAGKF